MNGTRQIAEFVVGASDADVPAVDLEAMERSCFDLVGVLLAGTVSPHARPVVEYVLRNGGTARASVLGSALRVPATEAALANGTVAHALDFDDFGSYGHPTVPIFPALLALAEESGRRSGREFVLACAVGFEVAHTLFAAGYNQYERVFHSTPLFGIIGATAACCRLLGVDADTTAAALGIAASQAGGIGRNNGTGTKPLHAGLAARGAVQAVLLARRGFTAAPDSFEQTLGFVEAFYGPGVVKLDRVIAGLGDPYKVARTVMIKKYPCCGGNHSALDGILELVAAEDLRYEDIVEVEVQAMPPTSPVLRYPDPRDGLSAKFSIHHAIAAAIHHGAVRIEDYNDEIVRSPEMTEARRKVRPQVMARWDPRLMYHRTDGQPVRVTLTDGRVLTNKVGRSRLRGSAAVPLTEDELVGKFRANTGLVLPPAEVDRAIAAWRRLSLVEDLSECVAALAGASVGD